MPESVKIAVYAPAQPSPKNPAKTMPPKMIDGNGRAYVIPKGLVDFVATHQGKTVEIEYDTKTNGNYTDYILTGVTIPTAPLVEKPAGTGWRRDPAESSLILRQVALKAAVEYVTPAHPLQTVKDVLDVAEQFNDWLHGRVDTTVPIAEQKAQSPEQRAAAEAFNTGGSYAEALSKQKPHVAASLKPNQNLADAVNEVLAQDIIPEYAEAPHPADTYGRERLRPSGAPRR